MRFRDVASVIPYGKRFIIIVGVDIYDDPQ